MSPQGSAHPARKRQRRMMPSAAAVLRIGREGQSAQVLTLAGLENTPVDMFTTVYIGNSNTRLLRAGWSRRGGTVSEGDRVSSTTEGHRFSKAHLNNTPFS